MKNLRMVRNVAALFILAMALLGATRPGTGTSQKACLGTKLGFNCSYDANGNCHTTKCRAGSGCSNSVCANFCFECK